MIAADEPGPEQESAPERLPRRGVVVGAAALAAHALVAEALAACGASSAPSSAPPPAPPQSAGGDTPTHTFGGDGSIGARDGGEHDDAPPRPVPSPDAVPEVTASFGLGVASGDAKPTGAVLWTRFDGTGRLSLTVWEMSDEAYVAEAFCQDVTPRAGGFVHVAVDFLEPSTRYRFAFFEVEGGERQGRSPIGRFRTAPRAGSLERLTFGATCCTKNGHAMTTIERAGERVDLDAFLLLGDTVYADGATDTASYRAKWAENLSTLAYRKLRAATSLVATWDDHEVANNWDAEKLAATQVEAARSAFFENLPVRRDQADGDRIYRSLRWGDTVEVFVLDCRGERRPSTLATDEPQYVSPAQLQWLEDGLTASPCVFKLIMNSVPISEMPPLYIGAGDRWQGYARQRRDILDFIADAGIGGVFWLAGDFHFASIGKVSPGGPGSDATEILVGPGAQMGDPLARLAKPPQFEWQATTNNYATFDLDPVARRMTLGYVDATGRIFHQRTFDV